MLRKVLAFFRRDVAIARSYRIAFALEILEAFFGVATFYYLSRFVSNTSRFTKPTGWERRRF
jgi:hypothetical protein